MTKPALNKRITAVSIGAIFKFILSFAFISMGTVFFAADRIVLLIFPGGIPFSEQITMISICLFLWLGVSGITDFMRISLAREIEDKLYVSPLTVKAFSDKRRKPGEKRLMRDISSLRRSRLFSSITLLEDCIVFERGADSRPLMLMAEKGMTFTENAPIRDFTMPFIFAALSILQFGLGGRFNVPLVFAVMAAILSSKVRTISYQEPAAPPSVNIEVEASGDSAADALIETGRGHLRELARLDKMIMDKPLSKNIQSITAATRQLLEFLSQSPHKHAQARQLIDYALPTTIKLIKQYDYLERQPVKGENIRKSMVKIIEMSGTVAEIMQKELDALYSDKTIDIEVDIEVLKGMMHNDMDINRI
jgi:hypothetical protein